MDSLAICVGCGVTVNTDLQEFEHGLCDWCVTPDPTIQAQIDARQQPRIILVETMAHEFTVKVIGMAEMGGMACIDIAHGKTKNEAIYHATKFLRSMKFEAPVCMEGES